MPYSKITLSVDLGAKEVAFVNDCQAILVNVLKIPESDRLIVVEKKTSGFYQPLDTSGSYALFEISLFGGRGVDVKKQLYQGLCNVAESYGIDPLNTRVILNEVAADNWGIRGGIPASEFYK